MTDNVGNWFSILEYTQLKGVSISTVRRGIKSNRLKHKLENGKYLIYSTNLNQNSFKKNNNNNEEFLLKENKLLRERVRKLLIEVDELNMLIGVYEQQSQDSLPELPQIL